VSQVVLAVLGLFLAFAGVLALLANHLQTDTGRGESTLDMAIPALVGAVAAFVGIACLVRQQLARASVFAALAGAVAAVTILRWH